MKVLTLEQKEDLKEKCRKKLQALLNYGFILLNTRTSDDVNIITTNLIEHGTKYTLSIPSDTCICIKVSDMTLRLLKPYIKDLLVISQKQTKTNFILFNRNDVLLKQLEPLAEENPDIQLLNSFSLSFDKYTLPTYTNRAGLYSVASAPTLTQKQLGKILELHEKIKGNAENYFLLSNNLSSKYNMPMTILRLLGENVISIRALNVLELILVFATNSNAIYRQPNDKIKPFAIPVDFFMLDDYGINQTPDDIMESLKELENIGLVNNFSLYEDALIIHSHIIVKSIKQYFYKQNQGYYKYMDMQQRNYVFTFINYLRYLKNISKREIIKDATGQEVEKIIKAEKLTISFEGLLYNLEQEKYFHDYNHLLDVLDVLRQTGVRQGLLLPNEQPLDKDLIKRLLNNRDELHTFFRLNLIEDKKEDISTPSTFYTTRMLSPGWRNLQKR